MRREIDKSTLLIATYGFWLLRVGIHCSITCIDNVRRPTLIKNTFNQSHRVHRLCPIVHYAVICNYTWHVRLSCTWLLSECEALRFQRPLKKPSYCHASWFQLPLKRQPYYNASRFQNPSARLSYCHASSFQSTPTSIFNCMISPYCLHSYIKVPVTQKLIIHEKWVQPQFVCSFMSMVRSPAIQLETQFSPVTTQDWCYYRCWCFFHNYFNLVSLSYTQN